MTTSPVRWVDNHCHLPDDEDAADALLAEAVEAGVVQLIDVGTDVARSRAGIARAERHDRVAATVGVHPHDAAGGVDGLAELSDHEQVVAIGECGLDYYYEHSPRDAQRVAFGQQIDLAHERSLPLVIHTRDAWDDTFDVLAHHGVPERTVFHCFTGGPAEAERGLALGAVLSFSGIVTFKSAADLQAAARLCPPDQMMVETDSPYLAPVPHRGKKNRPAWVVAVGSFIAELRGESVESVAAATTATASAFYGLHLD